LDCTNYDQQPRRKPPSRSEFLGIKPLAPNKTPNKTIDNMVNYTYNYKYDF